MTYMSSRVQSYYIQNHGKLNDFAKHNHTNPTKIYPTHDGAANNVPALTVQMIEMMQQHLSIKHTFDDQICSIKENFQRFRSNFHALNTNQSLSSDLKEKIDEIGFMVEELDTQPKTLRILRSNSTKKKSEQLTDSINELALLSNLEIQKASGKLLDKSRRLLNDEIDVKKMAEGFLENLKKHPPSTHLGKQKAPDELLDFSRGALYDEIDIQKKSEHIKDEISKLATSTRLQTERDVAGLIQRMSSSNDGIEALISDTLSDLNNTGEHMKFEKKRDLEKALSNQKQLIPVASESLYLEQHSLDDMKESIKQKFKPIQEKQPEYDFNPIIQKIFRSEDIVKRLYEACNFIPMLRIIMRDDILSRLAGVDERDKASFKNGVFDYKLSFLFDLYSHDKSIRHQTMKESIKQKFKPIQEKQPEYNFNPIIQKIFRSEVVVKRLHNACNFYPMLRIIMRDDILSRLVGVDERDKASFKNGLFNYKLSFLFDLYSHDLPIHHRTTPKKGLSH